MVESYGDKVELVDDTSGQTRDESSSSILGDTRDGVAVANEVEDLVEDVGGLGGQVVALAHTSAPFHLPR